MAEARFQPPRLPYNEAIASFGIDRAGWKTLVEAIYPSARSIDSIALVLSYCKARGLDPFKRPVHIVPVWNSAIGGMVETIWPGVGELRTTAMRTGQFAGMDPAEFGPIIEETFEGTSEKGKSKGKSKRITVRYPEWCRMTVYRMLGGQRCPISSPVVFWKETYGKWADTEVPNDMWAQRPLGQLEKCAEAAGLRRAFPEENGHDYTAEEMEGQRMFNAPPPPEQEQPLLKGTPTLSERALAAIRKPPGQVTYVDNAASVQMHETHDEDVVPDLPEDHDERRQEQAEDA